MELESLKPGLQVVGLVPNEMAVVIQALPAGADASPPCGTIRGKRREGMLLNMIDTI